MLGITKHISIDSPAAAKATLQEISRQVASLEDHPQLGRAGRLRGTRELVIAYTPYIAIYRIDADTVKIHRILHGARKWPRTL